MRLAENHSRHPLYVKCSLSKANRLQTTSEKVGNLAFLDVTGRIAQTLLNLAKQPDAMTHPDGMQIKITRQEIGDVMRFTPSLIITQEELQEGMVALKAAIADHLLLL